jgi:hypothetical protein
VKNSRFWTVSRRGGGTDQPDNQNGILSLKHMKDMTTVAKTTALVLLKRQGWGYSEDVRTAMGVHGGTICSSKECGTQNECCGGIVTSGGHLKPGRSPKPVKNACFTPKFWKKRTQNWSDFSEIFSSKSS